MQDRITPVRQTDAEARAIAAGIMARAKTAALAVLEADTGAPFVSRIAFALAEDGTPLTLISDLAVHSAALRRDPRAALLLGEPGGKGDPLTHPRLTLRATARFVASDDPSRPALRETWLSRHPKARLYADFADFRFVLFDVHSGHLNAGFARAYALDRNDLKVT